MMGGAGMGMGGAGGGAGMAAGGMGGGTLGLGGGAAGASTQLQLQVADNMVGAIVGKGGSTINELQQYSGARIKISQKGEYVPGTSNRTVTITGNPAAVQTAQFLLTQKVQLVQLVYS